MKVKGEGGGGGGGRGGGREAEYVCGHTHIFKAEA